MQIYVNNNRKAIPQMQGLTPQQTRVVYYIAWGWSDKQIAAILNISVNTVREHRKNINAATNSHNAADVTRKYFEHATGQNLGKGPSLAQIFIAMLFFVLTVFAELENYDMLRARRVKTASVKVKAKRARRRNQNLIYAA